MSNKTSDENVGNDSVIAHKFATMQQQIDKKDKRIKELEEELEKANRQLDLDYVDENFIPKQVVIDKIKEYRGQKNKYENEIQELFSNDYYRRKVVELVHKIDALQELLEGEE